MIDIYDLFTKMEVNNIMLSFKGDITSELMTSILHIMESRLDNLNEEPKVKKKVYNVLVECLQNLYHHIDEVPAHEIDKTNSGRSAIFMIGIGNNHYGIVTGNYMLTEKVPAFKQRLEKINALSPEELKNIYKEILNHECLSEKGGGGLLHGLPHAVKDLALTQGMRTTFGSPIYRDFVPQQDNLFVERLRQAGALIIGKTNTPEFGAGANTRNAVYGATGNPFDPAKSAAGSSGGSAVALRKEERFYRAQTLVDVVGWRGERLEPHAF